MDSETYIILIDCPLEDTPKYIISGVDPKYVPSIIKQNRAFRLWRTRIEYLNIKPQFSIIDKVKSTERLFWYDYYINTFKSWGFELFNGMTKYETMLEYNKHQLNKVLEKDSSIDDNYSDYKLGNHTIPKNFNINLIIYFLKDLINMKVSSKNLDDFTTIFILVFFYGYNLIEISQLSLSRLKYLFSNKQSDSITSICNYKELEKFILRYVDKYHSNFNMSDHRLSEILNMEHPFNSEVFDQNLNKLMTFLGYDCQVNYKNHEQIFCLLNIQLSDNKDKSRKYFSEKYGYSEEYLKLMTLNQTYCKVQLPGNTDSKILS